MRFVRSLAAAALVATTSIEAGAQTSGTLKFQQIAPNPYVTAFGYLVGPFWGTLTSDPTKPVIDLYCVDIFNTISLGKNWTANFSSLAGDLSLTRHGNSKAAQYQQAAFLASMFESDGITTSQWGGIQTAMWNLLNPGQPNGGTNPNVNSSEAYWLAKASNWYNNAGAENFDFSRWTVVTDVGAAGKKVGGGTQEFLTTGITPEPETWVLMGTGLLLVVGFAIKRGRLV
ncbi:MAG: PEP-CTERM sorting domain-containing protein [Gemmatimonadaceae bacterium]